MATVRQLRYALDTLRGYHQIQDLGQDGQAALALLNEHVTELERNEPPTRLCFVAIPPGSKFQIILGNGELDRDVYLKLKAGKRLLLSPIIAAYAVNLASGEICQINSDVRVKIVV